MIFWHSFLENAHRKIVTVKEFLERGVSFGSTRRGNKNIFKKENENWAYYANMFYIASPYFRAQAKAVLIIFVTIRLSDIIRISTSNNF